MTDELENIWKEGGSHSQIEMSSQRLRGGSEEKYEHI
jgi:hypothetical protein